MAEVLINHADITSPDLHESKGVAGANADDLPFADGAGSTTHRQLVVADVTDFDPTALIPGSTEQGVYDYNDLATATTPISLAVADTVYEMTNDGAGANTNLTYALPALTNIWNVSTDRFEFNGGTKLVLGDTVDIRFDVEVTTTSVNTAITLNLELGTDGTPYLISLVQEQNFKTTGTHKIVRWMGIYMGDLNTLNNKGRVLMSADSTGATVKVNGWYIRPIHTVQAP